MVDIILSDEQQHFVDLALKGKNILVDACIGSGKTTAVQKLCDLLPKSKKILYLTYNKLLKVDAQSKIKNKNARVTNYHSFAYSVLYKNNIRGVGVGELIQTFLSAEPKIDHYDVLILDEYQDISQEISKMLLYIKKKNPDMQIIAVGDMSQKIYDYTTLDDISGFIKGFLGNHEEIAFTNCFRLPKGYAAHIGLVWNKKIHGVNKTCTSDIMSVSSAAEFLGKQNPRDVLVLGGNGGIRAVLQNKLESEYSWKYNKRTLWSSIKADGSTNSTAPNQGSAIFTTYDGSKGMERPVCVICDFDPSYWKIRSEKPLVKYDILRNIFLVALSRGKEKIIFVYPDDAISEYSSTGYYRGVPVAPSGIPFPHMVEEFKTNVQFKEPMNMSSAFDYKYKEDVEAAYDLLEKKQVQQPEAVIETPLKDANIDISMCVGEYAEASYFTNYSIKGEFNFARQFSDGNWYIPSHRSIQQQILSLTAVQTKQFRYITQVNTPFVSDAVTDQIHKRLATVLPKDVAEQQECSIEIASPDFPYSTILTLLGRCDAIKDDCVYELKFVSDLEHTHFLQLALYLVAMRKDKGYLWNVRNNEMYEVTIPDRKAFMDAVVKAVTKRSLLQYCRPLNTPVLFTEQKNDSWKDQIIEVLPKGCIVPTYREFEQQLINHPRTTNKRFAEMYHTHPDSIKRWRRKLKAKKAAL